MAWVFLALVLGAAALPVVLERMRTPVNGALRNAAPGQFVGLSQGVTHYRWFGDDGGTPVVLVHGLTTPSAAWEAVARGLAEQGYRALTFDLYGRGYSDLASGAQTRAFFLRQLRDLMEALDLTGPVHLAGYSMGGSIATAFATAHPDRVRNLTLLASAGLRARPSGWRARLALMPGVGEWLMGVLGGAALRRGLRAQAGMALDVPGITDIQIAQTRQRGFASAVLSSTRHVLGEEQDTDHRAIAQAGMPVLAIWAGADTVIPATSVQRLTTANPQARQVTIDGATHAIAYSHAPDILAAMIPHLSKA